jgi:hypothetical protein
MKRALVDPRFDRIAQIIDPTVEDQFEVAPPLVWRNVPDGATTQDTYTIGGWEKFVRPPVPPVPKRSEMDPLARALIAKGVLTAEEVDA